MGEEWASGENVISNFCFELIWAPELIALMHWVEINNKTKRIFDIEALFYIFFLINKSC